MAKSLLVKLFTRTIKKKTGGTKKVVVKQRYKSAKEIRRKR